MKRKFGLTLLILVLGITTAVAISLTQKEKDATFKELEIFGDALHIIQSHYVEDVKARDLIYGALSGMLSSLDPYSQFLEPEDYKELLVDTQGQFGGLGIEISIKDGLLTVISPLENTPAQKAGVKAGDRIVKIEDELTRGINLTDAVKKLRGEPGTKVTITILREKTGKVFDVEITRDIISIKDIRTAEILKENVGYIALSEFRDDTAKELDKIIGELKAKGADAFILDLRNNPGGLLESAVEVSSRFLAPGKLVVYTLDKEDTKVDYDSYKSGQHITEEPLVVIVNEGSASGSEIVAGCIQSYHRGIIVGTTTFGKASVQTVLPLSDGAALRLTTARYYTPDGILIQDEGIKPDIQIEQQEVPDEATKEEQVFKEIEEKEKEKEKEKKEKDEKADKKEEMLQTDYQLIRALDLIKGMLIITAK